MAACARLYDVVRIDHFIGLARYFAIPSPSVTAKDGQWRQGPDKTLTDALDAVRGNTRIVAEDLGVVHPSVRRLLKITGYPGMKVLLFAFDSGADNEYLPHWFEPNCVVYGGTHDNETVAGFCQSLCGEKLKFVLSYLGVKRVEEIPRALFRAAYGSVADVAMFQMQDVLGLDNTARMNTPSTLGGNWLWRMRYEQMNGAIADDLCALAKLYGR